MLLGDFVVEFPGDPADAGMACVDLRGRRVADLCTASSFVAINAASAGAGTVTEFDVSSAAMRCARANALAAGVRVDPHLGSGARATEVGPFDVVLCNPPNVPCPPGGGALPMPRPAGPMVAVDGGSRRRLNTGPSVRSRAAHTLRRQHHADRALGIVRCDREVLPTSRHHGPDRRSICLAVTQRRGRRSIRRR
ncbi:MAG: release factor glutamine methyltransferase [Mycobacterium sp.]|jgi:methylase of polypeptide subunit release factors|nr:release factor glutamine methyltransferase [Mycobacterium sp.]